MDSDLLSNAGIISYELAKTRSAVAERDSSIKILEQNLQVASERINVLRRYLWLVIIIGSLIVTGLLIFFIYKLKES